MGVPFLSGKCCNTYLGFHDFNIDGLNVDVHCVSIDNQVNVLKLVRLAHQDRSVSWMDNDGHILTHAELTGLMQSPSLWIAYLTCCM